MTLFHGSRIPTDGLVLCADAANPKSYPGSGTTFFDISGNNLHGTISAAATWSASNSGVFQFVGASTSRIDFPSPGLSSGTHTVIVASRYTNSTLSGRVLSASSGNWLLGHHSTFCNRYYAGGWVHQPSTASDNNWRIFAGTGDTGTDTWQFYSNGQFVVSNALGVSGPPNFRLGGWVSGEWANGEVGILLAYNRVLSSEEIATIYNTYRARYSI